MAAPAGAVRRRIRFSADKSLQTFRLSEDFHVELFAAEPNVIDPVDMAFDENGKIYVAEMVDYPDDPPPGIATALAHRDAGGSRRRRPHRSQLDLCRPPSGCERTMPWKGGLIVTTAPQILYLKDTDGDGKADVRQVLYSGFRLQNPQHRDRESPAGHRQLDLCGQ